MEKLNLVEILKNCHQGIKLYSPAYGELEFDCIKLQDTISRHIIHCYDTIKVYSDRDLQLRAFNSDGSLIESVAGECVLFPSKEQRDWSKFKTPLQVEQFEPCECYWYKITGDKEKDAALLDKLKDLMPETTYLYEPGSNKFEKGKIVYNNVNHIEIINDVDRTFSQIIKMIGVELKVKE